MALFRKKNKNKNHVIEAQEDNKKSIGLEALGTNAERIEFIKGNYELINECNRQMEEAKAEYQAVTAYLTDMQKIDLIPSEERETLEEAAKKILSLTQERKKFHNKKNFITDQQYRILQQNEPRLPKELEEINGAEQYRTMIMADMEHLDREKLSLYEEREEIVHKQSFLKGIAVTISVIVVLLFAIFVFLQKRFQVDLSLPYILTILMAMISSLYLVIEASKNSRDVKNVGRKLNKAIQLLNKVKIKSVNNTNYLESIYSKYMVKSYEELATIWKEYLVIKEASQRYQKNTEQLEYYNKVLIKELERFALSDSEVWIYQPNAIIEPREMVEVRHRLNVRRQKIRERMDINKKQKEEALQEIQTLTSMYPECLEEVQSR